MTQYNISPAHFWNMDEKGYLIGALPLTVFLYSTNCITGLGTAQVYCVRRGTKEAKSMQGISICTVRIYIYINCYLDGNRELVTVIEAISGAGGLHKPTILLKGKNLLTRYLKYRIKPARYGNTERGWTTDREAIEWLEDFEKETRPYVSLFLFCLTLMHYSRSDPNQWWLLLIDGHGSHKTIEFITMCLNKKVWVFKV